MQEQINYYSDKLKYEIDSWDLYNSLQNEAKIIVIDARSKEAYDIEHIPNAINVPHRIMDELSTKDFDTSYTYVTYCDGIGCNASTKAALQMTKLGFTTKELLGGIDWWKRDGYETSGKNGTKGSAIVCGC